MPKVSLPTLPVSGLFGVAKPSGPTSMSIINDIKVLVSRSRLFADAEKLEIKKTRDSPKQKKRGGYGVKIGQGGTLDPLADGILVGIGKGTKRLSDFLGCTKEYRTTCLLGCETDTYDSEGARVRLAPWKQINKEEVEAALVQFTGEIKQTPPIFSALKMDGRPLYEYARNGIPLPRPIETREVLVHALELVEWKGSDHEYRWPEKSFSEQEKKNMELALVGTHGNISLGDQPETSSGNDVPTAFVLKMKVSGGTYVRSIVHDLCHALGSAGHVVTLTRSRQGRFVLEQTEDSDKDCVPWEVLQKASTDPGDVDEDGWTEWEREVIARLEVVE